MGTAGRGARDALEAALAAAQGPRARAVFTALHAASARDAADAADARARAGLSLGPLDGRLLTVKDLFDEAGHVTAAGSVILRDRPPAAADAPAVARLRRAGMVVLGRTGMSEFAFSGLGLNPHHGTPGNAADPARVPGGSSAGAGVAVALGLCDVGLGTDTAGSVRVPAALNGVVGFKPTQARVPMAGAFPLSYAQDSVGPLARTVEDGWHADAALAGEEPGPLAPAPLGGLRIGVARGRLTEGLEPAVEAAFEAGLARLARAGARVADHPIDALVDGMRAATRAGTLPNVESAQVHAAWLDARAAEFDPRVRARILVGRGIDAPAFVGMLRAREALIARAEAELADLDALALPTTATTAPLIAAVDASDEAFGRANLLMLRNTAPANYLGLCAISLPLPVGGSPVGGLPVGLMLMARGGQDRRLLRVAAAVEAALG